MNRPDCGNQETGQPRWAQLTARTRNLCPSLVVSSSALVADVDPGVRHHAVPRLADRVVEGHQARLVQREVRRPAPGAPTRPGPSAPRRGSRRRGCPPAPRRRRPARKSASGRTCAAREGARLAGRSDRKSVPSLYASCDQSEGVICRWPARPASRTPAARPGRRSPPRSAAGNPAGRPSLPSKAGIPRSGRPVMA